MPTFVVTGSASGMGAATTARLAAEGHTVIGVDLHGASVTVDLTDPEQRAAAVAEILRLCKGELAGAVTFAGLTGLTGIAGSTVLGVNYFGSVEIMKGLRPALAAGRGAALMVSSNSSVVMPNWPTELLSTVLDSDEETALQAADDVDAMLVYAVSKVAVLRWMRRNATQPHWAGAGISLNALSPGIIATPMAAAVSADETWGELTTALPIPMGAPAPATDTAEVAHFLLTNPAARYFCGSTISFDGGSEAAMRPDDWPSPWLI